MRISGLEVHVDPSTQYTTVYDDAGKPVATLQRARVYSPKGTPNWRMYDLSGLEIANGFSMASSAVRWLVRLRREKDISEVLTPPVGTEE